MRAFALLLTLGAVSLVGSVASAQEQPWLKDRRYGEGVGIRTGNLELHPGVAAELGYDSNYFQRSGGSGEDVYSTLRFRLTPSFSVGTLGAARTAAEGGAGDAADVEFRATGSATYSELFALDGNRYHREAARGQRHLSGALGLKVDILPHRPWGADLSGDVTRIMEPSNSPEDAFAFDRDLVRIGGGVTWRPTGGVLDWRVGYEMRMQYFEGLARRNLNSRDDVLKTRGHWRFLPRSALVYDASLGLSQYTSGGNVVLKNSRPIRTRLGFNGLVTSQFGLLAVGGWGASFFIPNGTAPVEDFDSFIAQAEAKWYISPQSRLPADGAKVGLSSIAAGYLRDFINNYFSDYYQFDRGYLKAEYFLGGVALLAAEAGVTHITFPRSYFPTGVDLDRDGVIDPFGVRKDPFSEDRIELQLFGEYRFGDRVGVNVTLRYNAAVDKASGADDNVVPMDRVGGVDDLSFSRFEGFVGGRWFW